MHSCHVFLWVALLGLSACSKMSQPQAQADELVNIKHAGLLLNDAGQPELGLTLTNNSTQTLWVNVLFQTPDNATDCVQGKELVTQAQQLFLCVQPNVRANVNYPLEIDIYSELEQQEPIANLVTGLRFTPEDIAILR